jgi:predicted dehydrogenase
MARISFTGELVDEAEIRVGVIGCGSHAFRNIYPTFQFAPVQLVATCDLDADKAAAFATKFGAETSYRDHEDLLARDDLDAVFIVVGYDDTGRPLYPRLAGDCLDAGHHVWMEKPPAASVREIEALHARADAAGKQVMVGFKKMFMPANERARGLVDDADFGTLSFARLEYPQYIPTVEEFERYAAGTNEPRVTFFLDHICHPVSALLYLAGMPDGLYYERAGNGAGSALFSYTSGALATIDFTWGAAMADGLERTLLASNRGRHVTVENNLRVAYHRMPMAGYGDVTDFYAAPADQATAVWEPEFSLGQLYNKGLFVLGYYGEINEFARAILDDRPVAKAGLDDARRVTHIFEAFARGQRERIAL